MVYRSKLERSVLLAILNEDGVPEVRQKYYQNIFGKTYKSLDELKPVKVKPFMPSKKLIPLIYPRPPKKTFNPFKLIY